MAAEAGRLSGLSAMSTESRVYCLELEADSEGAAAGHAFRAAELAYDLGQAHGRERRERTREGCRLTIAPPAPPVPASVPVFALFEDALARPRLDPVRWSAERVLVTRQRPDASSWAWPWLRQELHVADESVAVIYIPDGHPLLQGHGGAFAALMWLLRDRGIGL
jgi:hypothetical protein